MPNISIDQQSAMNIYSKHFVNYNSVLGTTMATALSLMVLGNAQNLCTSLCLAVHFAMADKLLNHMGFSWNLLIITVYTR